MRAAQELPILFFSTVPQWEQWLSKHHTEQNGAWLKIAKKTSAITSVTYDEALEAALCYGWIDGQIQKYDDSFYLQKFTHRRPRSLWSKRNIDKANQLIAAGKMQPSGLAEIAAAKNDGRWQAAYDSPKNMEIPADFTQALKANSKAYAFFKTLNRANTYAIAWRLQTAKRPETRAKRMQAIITMLAEGKKLHD